MWQRLLISRKAAKQSSACRVSGHKGLRTRCVEPREFEREKRGAYPLQLAFPTASWSSYSPSSTEGSYSDASCTSFSSPSYSETDQSQCSSCELTCSVGSPEAYAGDREAASASHLCRSGGGKLRRLKRWCNVWRFFKPWKHLGSRESRRTARSHALLYLALTDPALSTSALFSTDKHAQQGFFNASGEQDLEKDSNVVALSALIALTCIILLLAFAFGVAVGSALVHSRPFPGAAAIALVAGGEQERKLEWGKDGEYVYNGAPEGWPLARAEGRTQFGFALPAKEGITISSRGLGTRDKSAASTKISELELIPLHPKGQGNEPLAVLRGNFKVFLPQHNQSMLGGIESGIFLLEYIPAPHAGRVAEEVCFTSGSSAMSPEPSDISKKVAVPGSTTPAPADHRLSDNTGKIDDYQTGGASLATQVASDRSFAAEPLEFTFALPTAPEEPDLEAFSKLLHQEGATQVPYGGRSVLDVSSVDAWETIQQLLPLVNKDVSDVVHTGSLLPLHGEMILGAHHGVSDEQLAYRKQFSASIPAVKAPRPNEAAGDNEHLWWSPSASNANQTPSQQELEGSDSSPFADGLLADGSHGPKDDTFEAGSSAQNNPPKLSDSLNNSSDAIQQNSRGFSAGLHLLAASFQPVINAQGGGFRALEVSVTLNHQVFSPKMYQDLLQDCRLGRLYVQLSTSLAYYTIFYWNDMEPHQYLPFSVPCVEVPKLPSSSKRTEQGDAAQ